jgi:hypothetical protein
MVLIRDNGERQVARPVIGTNVWVSIIAGIALVVGVLSSPIRAPQASNVCVQTDFPSGTLTLAPGHLEAFLAAATPGETSLDLQRCVFIEETEDESSCLSGYLFSPSILTPVLPPKVHPGPLLGNSPPRTVAVLLRC